MRTVVEQLTPHPANHLPPPQALLVAAFLAAAFPAG